MAGRAIESLGAAPGKQLPVEGDLRIVGDGQSELAEGERPRLARQHGVIVGKVLFGDDPRCSYRNSRWLGPR